MRLNWRSPLILLCVSAFAAGAFSPVRASAAGGPVPDKPALELAIGESELLSAGENVSWSVADPSVATVSKSGVVLGVGAGETTVTVSDGKGSCDIPVYVIEKERGFDDNILISVFWPPTAEYMNGGEGDERWDEQFRLLSEAQIDYLCNVTGRDRQQNIGDTPRQENTKETNLKMALYAHKYGMRVSVADERFGTAFLTSETVGNIISEYRNVPGVGGYYILDEPFDPMPYAPVYEEIKAADPSGYAHLNFQPLHAYGVPIGTLNEAADEKYRGVLAAWLEACEESGFPQDYLMFDFYPYTDAQGGMARDIYFANLNAVREVGLQYGVKTANYLQSTSSVLQANGALAFRSATPAEIRYEAMTSLAYGYKQLSYFTWFLPTNRNGETFSSAIVDENGVPNEKYYAPLSALNAEIHALGKTLIGLEAVEVYQNGTQWGWQEPIPMDFLLQPLDEKEYTVSLLAGERDSYVMIVNNDYSASASFSLQVGEEVKTLRRVSPQTGELEAALPIENGTLSLTLAAGDGVLFAVNAEEKTVEPASPEEEEGGCGAVLPTLGGSLGILTAAALPICFVRRRRNS